MIKRIVKLSFREDETENFIQIFQDSKDKIRARKGCLYLELLRGKRDSNIFFTYSFWESEDDLNAYRHSDLFKTTWAKTKALFSAKPEAWSVDSLEILE
jgi:heme-degrading monooxygenase HmoA